MKSRCVIYCYYICKCLENATIRFILAKTEHSHPTRDGCVHSLSMREKGLKEA